jgi:hypothetical protein
MHRSETQDLSEQQEAQSSVEGDPVAFAEKVDSPRARQARSTPDTARITLCSMHLLSTMYNNRKVLALPAPPRRRAALSRYSQRPLALFFFSFLPSTPPFLCSNFCARSIPFSLFLALRARAAEEEERAFLALTSTPGAT